MLLNSLACSFLVSTSWFYGVWKEMSYTLIVSMAHLNQRLVQLQGRNASHYSGYTCTRRDIELLLIDFSIDTPVMLSAAHFIFFICGLNMSHILVGSSTSCGKCNIK
ncbi:hypothetical protein VNO78_16241 [Psophocarpus tetragonolobus]|uniref:Secreted protein n=1 Tax=Psophocarpus tetragonolobus TaxID=3891 RepID=A0AAN9SGT9_PSOTE